jgi:hypothetical protein
MIDISMTSLYSTPRAVHMGPNGHNGNFLDLNESRNDLISQTNFKTGNFGETHPAS